jgi:hypothetical protein
VSDEFMRGRAVPRSDVITIVEPHLNSSIEGLAENCGRVFPNRAFFQTTDPQYPVYRKESECDREIERACGNPG